MTEYLSKLSFKRLERYKKSLLKEMNERDENGRRVLDVYELYDATTILIEIKVELNNRRDKMI